MQLVWKLEDHFFQEMQILVSERGHRGLIDLKLNLSMLWSRVMGSLQWVQVSEVAICASVLISMPEVHINLLRPRI